MKLKKLTALLLCLTTLALVACSGSELDSNREAPSNTADLREPEIRLSNVDRLRREYGDDEYDSDEDVLEWMLGLYNSETRCNSITLNIITIVAVEITQGESNGVVHDSRGGHFWDGTEYVIRVIDNLTGHDIPEYLTIASRFGDVFEIGREYVILPFHNYSVLFDSWQVNHWFQVISRDLVSDDYIERIRESGESRRSRINAQSLVAESASLSQDFISNVDIVALLTVTDVRPDHVHDNIFDISFDLVEIIQGHEHEEMLAYFFRCNHEVRVGETYLFMLNVEGIDIVLPAARNGAVVSADAPEFAQYRSAFAALATE
jgi:hypothetical protein